MIKVAIIQRILPHYRIPFFEDLFYLAEKKNIQISLYYGQGTKEEKSKGDEVSWDKGIQIKNKYLKVKNKYLNYQPCFFASRKADLIITEQATRNLLTPLLLAFKKNQQKIALWGHGKNFQDKNAKSKNEVVKQRFNKKVDYFFAYNDLSKKVMIENGIEENKITSVMNSIDTDLLKNDLANVTNTEISNFMKSHQLTEGKTAVFCSSMYPEKLLEDLIEASNQITKKIPKFKLLMIGSGPDLPIVQNAANENEHIIYLGKLYGKEKALAYRCSDIMMNPGLVGLNILDSFIAEIPMITTDYPFHSPEIDYLVNHENGILCSKTDYVNTITDLLSNHKLTTLKSGCYKSAQLYTIKNMANNFLSGIQKCLQY